MTVVSDAGPLMALAKVGGLDVLFRLYPKVLTPPAVFDELVAAGLRLGAPDAPLLAARYRTNEIVVVTPKVASLAVHASLGAGEVQSILLAVEQRADWLLIDDLDARRAAADSLAAAGSSTRLKGTLGVILEARKEAHLSHAEAVQLVEDIRQRPDIWISSSLCDHALVLLAGSSAP